MRNYITNYITTTFQSKGIVKRTGEGEKDWDDDKTVRGVKPSKPKDGKQSSHRPRDLVEDVDCSETKHQTLT
jgi:hypothetical protein